MSLAASSLSNSMAPFHVAFHTVKLRSTKYHFFENTSCYSDSMGSCKGECRCCISLWPSQSPAWWTRNPQFWPRDPSERYWKAWCPDAGAHCQLYCDSRWGCPWWGGWPLLQTASPSFSAGARGLPHYRTRSWCSSCWWSYRYPGSAEHSCAPASSVQKSQLRAAPSPTWFLYSSNRWP